jgi:hypothetical protein
MKQFTRLFARDIYNADLAEAMRFVFDYNCTLHNFHYEDEESELRIVSVFTLTPRRSSRKSKRSGGRNSRSETESTLSKVIRGANAGELQLSLQLQTTSSNWSLKRTQSYMISKFCYNSDNVLFYFWP